MGPWRLKLSVVQEPLPSRLLCVLYETQTLKSPSLSRIVHSQVELANPEAVRIAQTGSHFATLVPSEAVWVYVKRRIQNTHKCVVPEAATVSRCLNTKTQCQSYRGHHCEELL